MDNDSTPGRNTTATKLPPAHLRPSPLADSNNGDNNMNTNSSTHCTAALESAVSDLLAGETTTTTNKKKEGAAAPLNQQGRNNRDQSRSAGMAQLPLQVGSTAVLTYFFSRLFFEKSANINIIFMGSTFYVIKQIWRIGLLLVHQRLFLPHLLVRLDQVLLEQCVLRPVFAQAKLADAAVVSLLLNGRMVATHKGHGSGSGSSSSGNSDSGRVAPFQQRRVGSLATHLAALHTLFLCGSGSGPALCDLADKLLERFGSASTSELLFFQQTSSGSSSSSSSKRIGSGGGGWGAASFQSQKGNQEKEEEEDDNFVGRVVTEMMHDACNSNGTSARGQFSLSSSAISPKAATAAGGGGGGLVSWRSDEAPDEEDDSDCDTDGPLSLHCLRRFAYSSSSSPSTPSSTAAAETHSSTTTVTANSSDSSAATTTRTTTRTTTTTSLGRSLCEALPGLLNQVVKSLSPTLLHTYKRFLQRIMKTHLVGSPLLALSLTRRWGCRRVTRCLGRSAWCWTLAASLATRTHTRACCATISA
jgi:hypothetical protein